MLNLAAITPRLAHTGSDGWQIQNIPRTPTLCAAAAIVAIALAILGAITDPAHADGGASARRQTAAIPAPNDNGATIRAYTLRILRALTDRNSNNWVRYWQARAACAAAATRAAGHAPPRARALTSFTTAICAQLHALLGVNPAAHTPRDDDRAAGLMINEPGAALGYTLFCPRHSQYIYLIDPLGRVAHTWNLKDNLPGRTSYHAKLLDNGNLMIMPHTPFTLLMEVDPRGNAVWQYENPRVHHDFLKMPSGNIMMIVWARKTREQAIAAGANPEFVHQDGIKYDHLLEVRPKGASGGEVVWEWSVWDHLIQDFDPAKPNYGAIAEHPELIDINFPLESKIHSPLVDWTHINAIDYNPELDQIMLSPRHFSELWIIDHSPTTEEARGHSGGNSGMGGDLLYRWGNPRAYGHAAADQRLFWQHQTHWIPPGLPGAGNILAFNNGNEITGYKRRYSSVDEIAPPVDGYRYRRDENAAYPPGGLEWTYAAETPTDFYAPILSGAQRLPNGNTLIADGTAGTIFQVTPNGKTVWKYILPRRYHISLWQNAGAPPWPTYGTPDNSSTVIRNDVYRARWYPPDHPGLQALDLAPGAYLEDAPDLLEWVRASLTDGDFGQPLADALFDIYLDENILIYFKRRCAAEDAQPKFYLHIFPANARDLPPDRQDHGFAIMDFNDNGGDVHALADSCIAIAPLPRYPIQRIRTGQFTPAGQLWRAEINLND